MKVPYLAVSAALLILQAGCVTGRRELTLAVPTNAGTGSTTGRVLVTAVTDDPSTPSIDADVTKLSPQDKDRMIGRQRNGFGHAMGDVSPAANDSVTKQIRLLIEQGLHRKGYQLTQDPSAPNAMTISTKEFWSWVTPGFVALTFEAKIRRAISVTNATGSHTIIVKGYGLNHGRFAKDVDIVEAFDPAYADFLANFADNADNLGLLPDAAGARYQHPSPAAR